MAINIKPSHKGLLHKNLGVPQGEHIPKSKLAIKDSDSEAVRKRKQFAINASKWKHADGGTVLNEGQKIAYNNWLKNNNIEESEDYDMKGYWKEKGFLEPKHTGHFDDTYKVADWKPFTKGNGDNYPAISEGSKYSGNPNYINSYSNNPSSNSSFDKRGQGFWDNKDNFVTYASGGRTPIKVSDPNDPRIEKYNDSLSRYNWGIETYKNDNKLNPNATKTLDNSLIGKGEFGGGYTNNNPIMVWKYEDKINGIKDSESGQTVNTMRKAMYKKPVQPYVYEKPENNNNSTGTLLQGAAYDARYPPIYVSDRNDPRIGYTVEAGNRIVYRPNVTKPKPAAKQQAVKKENVNVKQPVVTQEPDFQPDMVTTAKPATKLYQGYDFMQQTGLRPGDYTETQIQEAMKNKSIPKKSLGGYAMYGNGGINNPGFNALPQNVQQKILANMAMGGPVLGENMYGNGGYLPKHVLGKTVGAQNFTVPPMHKNVAESSGYNQNVLPINTNVVGLGKNNPMATSLNTLSGYGADNSEIKQVGPNRGQPYTTSAGTPRGGVGNYNMGWTHSVNDKNIADARQHKIDASIAARKANAARLPGTPGSNWKQNLADETSAIGDKLRVSNYPNVFDDYVNPAALVGTMASHIGQAPLQSQETHSAMPWLTALGEPLAAGALSNVIHPLVHKMHIPTSTIAEGAIEGNMLGNAAKAGMNQLVKRGATAAEHQGLTAVKGQIEGEGAHHANGGMVTPKYRYSNGRFLPMHTPGGSVGGETVVGTPPATRFQKMGGMNMVSAVADPLLAMVDTSEQEKYLSDTERGVQGAIGIGADVAIASGNPIAMGIGLGAKGLMKGYNALDLGGSMAEGRAKEKTYNTNVQNTKNIYGVGDQSITRQSYNNNNAYAYGGMTVINKDHPNPQEEVEGGESAMLPNGKNVQFKGPKHTNGGIKTSLPEGTRIFSDQLIYPGKK